MTPKEVRELTKSFSVLFVEDDDALRQASAKLFSQFFASIDEAVDGVDGWQQYQSKEYDLVITDINMPNMDGVELVRLIREKKPEQAIIVTSAYDDAAALLRLIDIGIDKFLIKPMDYLKIIDSLVHTAFYIQNKQKYFDSKEKIALLEAEIVSLKAQLAQTERIPNDTGRLSQEDSALLKAIEQKFSKSIFDIQMLGDYPDHLKEHMLSALEKYAEILFSFDYAQELAKQMNKLDQSIEKDEHYFASHINQLCTLLEDVSKNLKDARKSNFGSEESERLIKSMKKVMAILRPN